jgi:nicotinamidase-related amidase
MDTALLLVDIQQDYFPGGRMEVVGSPEAGHAAKKILNHFREKRLTIVHIQHISVREGATFFLPDTEGINIHPDVKPLSGEAVLKKRFPNSFRETGLNDYLGSRGVQNLVVCGMMSHMCIDATVRAAFDAGYICMVAHDACATVDLSFNGMKIPSRQVHAAYMAALSAVYAKVLNAEEIIARV